MSSQTNLSFSCSKWHGISYFSEACARCGKNVWSRMNHEKAFNKIPGLEVALSYCYLASWILKEPRTNDCMTLLLEAVKLSTVHQLLHCSTRRRSWCPEVLLHTNAPWAISVLSWIFIPASFLFQTQPFIGWTTMTWYIIPFKNGGDP